MLQAVMQVIKNQTEGQNLKYVDNIDSSDRTDDSMSEMSSRGGDFENNLLDMGQQIVSSVEVKQELP